MNVIAGVLLLAVQAPGAPQEREPGNSPWLEVGGNRFRVYGFPRLDMIYTDSRLAPNNQFPFWVVSEDPTVQAKDDDEELDLHPRLSRIGIQVERDSIPRWPSAKISGTLEFDFQNGGSESREAVRMRHAYLRVRDASGFGFLAGQTWDLIAPLLPSVNGDSLGWNVGNLGDRRPQLLVDYLAPAFDETKAYAAVAALRTGAINNRDLDGDGTADGIDSGKPMLQARLGLHSFLGRIDVHVWGLYAWDEVDTPVGGEDEFVARCVGADLTVRLAEGVAIAGEVWKGENLDDVRGGVGQGVNAVTGEEIDARGGWGELRFRLTEGYTPSVGISYDDPDRDDLNPAALGGPRDLNRTAYLSNHFDLGGGLQIGLEYIYWKTNYVGLDDGDANRLNLWLIYKF